MHLKFTTRNWTVVWNSDQEQNWGHVLIYVAVVAKFIPPSSAAAQTKGSTILFHYLLSCTFTYLSDPAKHCFIWQQRLHTNCNHTDQPECSTTFQYTASRSFNQPKPRKSCTALLLLRCVLTKPSPDHSNFIYYCPECPSCQSAFE